MKNWAEVHQVWLILGSREENQPLVSYCMSMKNWAEVGQGWLILDSREENQSLPTVRR